MVEKVRRDGYAFTRPPLPMRIHGMAVPILAKAGLGKERVLGCISMRFPRTAMSEEEAGSRFGKRLASVARAIAADVVVSGQT
jgi:IclR family mhp operon transcriptional activator